MATQLLPSGTAANVTGSWVRSSTGGKKTLPARISAAPGTYLGDGIYIEHLVGGLPNSKLANGKAGPFPPGTSDTGSVLPLGNIPEGGGDLAIHEPVEFIRARTGAFSSGTSGYVGIEYDA
jgi:hypothetical protein